MAVGTGYAVEYAGPAIRALPIEGRLTICNMSIEFGARSGIDRAGRYDLPVSSTGRPYAPKGALWDAGGRATGARCRRRRCAAFDREIDVDCGAVKPQITWGTSPQEVIGIDERIPDPSEVAARAARRR